MAERRVVVARVLGAPAPGIAVWKSVDDPDISGDLDGAPDHVRQGDHVVLSVERVGFRWTVHELVEHRPTAGGRTARRRRPHAHPARPPGTVLIAWLPFTREGEDAPGKHRPVVVLHSADPTVLRVRPLFDPGSAQVARSGGVQLEGWRAAGLDKASVAVAAVEVPVRYCEQTLGAVVPSDRRRLGIDRPRRP